jgi:xanthosine utilization system XapX-like protein
MALDLQKQILSSPQEAHAAQDGVTLGILFSLVLVFPPAAALALAAVGIDSVSVKKLVKKADEVVRTEDIASSPEYFLVPFVVTASPGIYWALTRGVTVPF